MSASQSTSFGVLLRNGRVVAGLTQEALADRSGLGIRSIQGLERGETRPRRETLRRLTEALRLAGEELATFERVGRPSPRRHHHSGSLADGARHQEETQPTSRLNPEIHPITPAPEYGHAGADRLVGRTHEVNVLRTKLEGALANRGSVVLVGGEAGIGKTRLVEELAVEAGQHGMLVLWGRCWESEGAPPLWPWIEIVRGIVRHRGPLLRSDLGSGAPLIAGLVPEIHEALRDLPPAPPLEPGEGRFRLFDAVTTALQNVSRSQPLLLVLEDLHWADKPSLVLLEFFLHYIAGARVGPHWNVPRHGIA
jgi:transcriptional regulator with XRE-family HTH domain